MTRGLICRPRRLARVASMTVIVSWLEFATKMRRPSGEETMFHGSAPVRNLPLSPTFLASPARNRRALSLAILITETVPSAALATYA